MWVAEILKQFVSVRFLLLQWAPKRMLQGTFKRRGPRPFSFSFTKNQISELGKRRTLARVSAVCIRPMRVRKCELQAYVQAGISGRRETNEVTRLTTHKAR